MAGRSLRAACVLATLSVSVGALASCGGAAPPIPPVHVVVGAAPHELLPGTTFARAVAELGLQARSGRLLSVTGDVLDADANPGAILLNRRTPSPDTYLVDGDVITVVQGRDRTEPSVRSVTQLPGMHLGDPELSLRRYRIHRITVRGTISGDVATVRDVPVGPGKAPRAVALSFDDGPWPGQTGKVLSILHRLHARATFFMVGYLVARYPGIVGKVRRAGMEIGDHSWDHPIDPAFANLPRQRVTEEIAMAKTALTDAGVHATLFRPPGGSVDDFVVQEARRLGLRVVNWNVDPQDWRPGATARSIAKRVLSNVGPGSIVLMHDGGGDRTATIRALPKIIKGIRRMHLKLVTIPAEA